MQCGGEGSGIDSALLKQQLTYQYTSNEEALAVFLKALGLNANAQNLEILRVLIAQWPAEPYPGIVSWLNFLKRKGTKLVLVSNIAQVFYPILDRSGLLALFDHVILSFQVGLSKPQPEIYSLITKKLHVPATEIIFIGDHPVNDGEAPSKAGFRSIVLGHTVVNASVVQRDQLPFIDLQQRVNSQAPDNPFPPSTLRLLSDEQQGRYNILAVAQSSQGKHFIKRAAIPESLYVEHTAHEILNIVDLGIGTVELIHSFEPFLRMPEVPGRHWQASDLSEQSAYELGRQQLCAFIIGNADLRPRNAFWDEQTGRLYAIDLELCFVDRILQMENGSIYNTPYELEEAFRKQQLKTKLHVVSEVLIRRVRREFIKEESFDHPWVLQFKRGWIDQFEIMKTKESLWLTKLEVAISSFPYLKIGTNAHRRFLTNVDLEDIRERLNLDPEQSFYKFY